ncbi:TRAP transporter substrate-binding protein DctP [Alloalcanivorax xenomutans]|uniref:TRAP transporter substrate-binding protein DctP n=1 Tax=Alloalcanivorax xenomutans TaxID=1094342 RepID=A0A9Q3W9X3_9GAMM|nr:TRAP transporter substrate-binding protein DctP [Alloalcanivorax xenomutans]ARB47164.1 hypothetical protein P40_18605 [Alloalcanivorax xenomutans]MCE7510807.1 TRAP transporter substrate-binding protein DctP [Alloalcanivorax xenomutans]MCE7525322.1 TRAP transporter substrate-binding protein DctP [Alloalcanivorax xenomutans]
MKKTITGTIFGAGFALAASPAISAVTLTFADWQVPAAVTTKEAAAVFMDKAKELSGGEIDFKYFPSEQLGKGGEMLRILKTGVADVTHISPAYITDKFPLSTVAELPGMPLDSCALANATYDMAQPGGILYEQELKPKGIRLLFAGNLGPYSILTTEKPVKSLGDLSGLKIRTAGGPMEMTANSLGANAIRMAGSEIFPSLSRGTLDGVLWPIPMVTDWSLEDTLNYMVPNLSTGSFVVTYSISDQAWNKLNEKQQKALMEAGKFTTKHYCEYVNDSWDRGKKELEDSGKVKSYMLPEAQVKEARESFETVNQTWVKSLEKRGQPAGKAYKEFKERVAE